MNKRLGALVFAVSVALGGAAVAQTPSASSDLFLDPYGNETLGFVGTDFSESPVARMAMAEQSPSDPEFFLDHHESEAFALVAADRATSCAPSIPSPALTRDQLSEGSAEIELAVAAQRDALALADVFGLADPAPAEILTASLYDERSETTGSIRTEAGAASATQVPSIEQGGDRLETPTDAVEVYWP
jgi:hypothetical protein